MINEKYELDGLTINNRVVFQPMEGCDCKTDGAPDEYTRRKYLRFAEGGAGVIWFEATAVCEEGKTNPRQMALTEKNSDEFKRLIEDVKKRAYEECGFEPRVIAQLTHSGRQSMRPIVVYRNEIYEKTRPITDENVASDDYLDSLPEKFGRAASLAERAGFDGVDVKCCHGYLMQESLSAFGRKGRYGGSFGNRSRLFLNSVAAVVKATKIPVVSRLGISELVPRPFGFGTDELCNVDLTEPKMLIERAVAEGVKAINVTLGNPYYNPHINRPYRKGFYQPPESPETGVERFVTIESELKKTFPSLPVIGSGLSYYRGDMMKKAEEMLAGGVCDLVGFGRQTLAYPRFYRDYLQGKFDEKKCCVTCSKCTELMRNKCVAGCAVFDEVYRDLYKERILCRK